MFDIIADSACDFTPEMAQKMGVEIVPFYVSLDGEHYRKEGKEIAVRDFYQFMVDNPSAYPKTSLASIEDFEEVFRRQAEAGRPTLCLCFTGRMSGCVGSARNARELVLEDYPDAKIEVMDSAAATVTEATMVENAVAIRDAGCTLDEAVTWLEAEKSTNNIFFTVGNLDYLIKGGRIGKVSGRAANFLGIKPMILFKDGEIFSGGVARGRQKSFEKALEQLRCRRGQAALDADPRRPACQVPRRTVRGGPAADRLHHRGPYRPLCAGHGHHAPLEKAVIAGSKKSSPIGRGFFCVLWSVIGPRCAAPDGKSACLCPFRRPAGQVRCG